MLKAPKLLSSVMAQQHQGNAPVHGELQSGWHSQAAPSAELSMKTAGGRVQKMPVVNLRAQRK